MDIKMKEFLIKLDSIIWEQLVIDNLQGIHKTPEERHEKLKPKIKALCDDFKPTNSTLSKEN